MESNNDVSSRRRQRQSFSSKVKGKLRSLSRSRQKTRSSSAALEDSESETDTLINFAIDSSNQDAYILEESPEESDVHGSPSHPLSGHASSVTTVRPQDSTDALDQDNTAWSSRKPRKQTKKKSAHMRDVVSKSMSRPSEPTTSDGQARESSSTSSAEQ